MKRILCIGIIQFVLFTTSVTFAQDLEVPKYSNLFKYGEKVENPGQNFENLFKNFPTFVRNAEQIQLLKYKLIDSVESEATAIKYLSKNIYPNAPAWDYNYITDGQGNIKEITIVASKTLDSDKVETDALIGNIAKNDIKRGDLVYELQYRYNLIDYKYYIFIDKVNNLVRERGNLFAFKAIKASRSK